MWPFGGKKSEHGLAGNVNHDRIKELEAHRELMANEWREKVHGLREALKHLDAEISAAKSHAPKDGNVIDASHVFELKTKRDAASADMSRLEAHYKSEMAKAEQEIARLKSA